MRIPNIVGIMQLLPVLLFLVPALHAQQRSSYFDEPAEVVLPENYSEGGSYPLLVMLPYTGGSAFEQARAFGIEPGHQEDFILLLPEGRFDYSDYLPNFMSFVSWFEQRLYEDISNAVDEYSVNPRRVYLAGYSLGGDLSWALSVRNPEDFSGAVVAGSRSSHPVARESLSELAEHGFRAAFLIGSRDSRNRYNGINHARNRLEATGIPVWYREYDGAHELPSQALAIEALKYVSRDDRGGIVAAGSSWPHSPGASSLRDGSVAGRDGSVAGSGAARTGTRSSGLLAGLRGGPPTGRLRLEADLPIAVSTRYETGIGYSGAGAGRMVFESFFDSLWLSADLEIESGWTTTEAFVRRASSGIRAAYGENVLWGGGVSWDWARWISDSPMLHDFSNPGSGDIFGQARVSAVALLRDGRRHTPRARVRLTYEIPTFLDPVMFPHIANAQLGADAWVTDWLLLDARSGTGTRVRSLSETRRAQADSLDGYTFWSIGAGFPLNSETTLSASTRGEWLRDLGNGADDADAEYSQEWRLSIRYSIF